MPQELQWALFAIFALSIKFYAYYLYAKTLNKWFEKVHNPYKISSTRIGLSLAFTGLNQLIFMLTKPDDFGMNFFSFGVQGVFLALIFSILSWYIILWWFYDTNLSKTKALIVGVVLSLALAFATAFLGFIVALNNINFC
jgi:hypothetical protein